MCINVTVPVSNVTGTNMKDSSGISVLTLAPSSCCPLNSQDRSSLLLTHGGQRVECDSEDP